MTYKIPLKCHNSLLTLGNKSPICGLSTSDGSVGIGWKVPHIWRVSHIVRVSHTENTPLSHRSGGVFVRVSHIYGNLSSRKWCFAYYDDAATTSYMCRMWHTILRIVLEGYHTSGGSVKCYFSGGGWKWYQWRRVSVPSAGTVVGAIIAVRRSENDMITCVFWSFFICYHTWK